MKSLYILQIICLFFMLTACGGGHNHTHGESCEGHGHSKEHSHANHAGHDHGEHDSCSGDHDHSHEEREENSDEIIFPVEQAEAVGLKVEEIHSKTFQHVIPASGQVLTAQGDENVVVANVAGIVSFRTVVTEGIQVSKGTSLITLSSRNLLEGDPVLRAKVAYETAEREYQRAQKLVENQIISEKEFNALQQEYLTAKISYEAVAGSQTATGQNIVAPAGGYVKNVLVNEGDYVEVGQPLLTITQNQKLYLRAEVSERHYKWLRTITSANFKTPYDDQVYELSQLKGKVLSYGKASDNSSFYVPVTFEFNNQGDIIPGSFVSVYLLSNPIADVISLPHTALTEEQGLYFVYLQLDEEGYKKQPVKLGMDNGKEVQILSGVNYGDRVVTEGAYYVKLASAVNALPAHSHEH